jgi:hypothetical protein
MASIVPMVSRSGEEDVEEEEEEGGRWETGL